MPAPIVAAGIAAGAQLLGTGATAYAQGKMNKKTRAWNEKMHGILRQESLADYAMQNDYNSPQAQMQRYRDANLNPALIYGQSNEGATVRSSEAPTWNPRAPQFDLNAQPALAAYYDVQLKEANIDNLRTQNTVLIQEAALKAATTANTTAQTAKTEFELSQSNRLKEISLQTAQANLTKTETETQVSLDRNQREAAMNTSNIKEATERVAQIKLNQLKTQEDTQNTRTERARLEAIIRNVDKDTQLKDLDYELKKKGIQPTDPIWMRIISNIISNYGGDILEKAKKILGEAPTTPFNRFRFK